MGRFILTLFPVNALPAVASSARHLSFQLLRALLAIVVDLQFVVWLTCFDDAALHDALLFTCCSLPFFGSAG